MASKSLVPDSITAPRSGSDPSKRTLAPAAIWAGFVTIIVAGPWLSGGYLFGTDWPGPRRFAFPTDLTNSAPLEAAMAAVSRVASGELTGKVLVLGVLFVAALAAFRAVPGKGFVPGAVASAVYVFNPFVFGRLHYGQMFVIAGYALLPWVAARVQKLLVEPGVKAGVMLALSLSLVGVASVHMFLIAFVLVSALAASHLVLPGKRLENLVRFGPGLLLAAGVTLVVSSYWLVPLALGRGPIASAVAGVTRPELTVFAAVPDPQLGLIPNLLGLYGFWAEDVGRFTSMKAFVPFWPAVLAVLLSIGAVGAVAAFRSGRHHLAPWVAGLLIAGCVALVLEMGVSHALTSGLVTWLDSALPAYRGMRDAGKWAALLAFVYSQLIGQGAAVVLGWFRRTKPGGTRAEWVGAVATGMLLAVPLYYGNGLLFGTHGEIKPSDYAAGWYAADRVLAADPHPGRVLFLPWHEYMSLSFVRNQNNVVANPAASFFSAPMLSSADPELPGIAPPADPDRMAVAALLGLGGQASWAEALVALGVKYVLVAHEVDWLAYKYLDDQLDLVRVGEYGSITLYRNSLET